MTDWNEFKGAAKPIEDIDLPRIAATIGVGEDEVHALIETETSGKGFDAAGRPKMLFEPHVFYRELSGSKLAAAVKAGLAYATWGEKKYPRDSYPRLLNAIAIDETAALKSASWGLGQVLGTNHAMAGYDTVQKMVRAMMADEENHLEAMVKFVVSAKIDDDLRVLAALKRPTTPEDCITIVRTYNGPGYAKNNYHVKFAKAHNKWRKIKDTPYAPAKVPVEVKDDVNIKPTPIAQPETITEKKVIEHVQILLRDKGYPEVGDVDGKFGGRTQTAIESFQSDMGLPKTGIITDELLAQLIKAPVRQQSAARAGATATDLKEKGDGVVNLGDHVTKIAIGVLTTGGLGGLIDGTASLDDIKGGIANLNGLIEVVKTVSPWLILAVVGGIAFYYGKRVIKTQVDAYRQGRAL